MKILVWTSDVTERVLIRVADCVEDHYSGGSMPLEEFIDQLCTEYLLPDWDIASYDTPAVRKIMRHAQAVQRELH